MLPCLRLLRVVSLVCAALTVGGLAEAQQPPAAKPPAQKPTQPAGQPTAPAAAAKDPVVATVNGQPVYLSELEVAQQALPAQYRNVPLPSVYPALLERIINSKLVVADAKKNKADADTAFKKRMAFVEEQVVQDYWLTKEVAKRITAEKMQQRYEEKLKSMPAEEEVHARHILVATEPEAKDLLAELKKGAAFDKLAREKSTDKASGGSIVSDDLFGVWAADVEMDGDMADPLRDDLRTTLHHGDEERQGHVARVFGMGAARFDHEADIGDDVVTRRVVVAMRIDVGHRRDDVDRARLAAVRRIEQRNVAGTRGHPELRTTAAHGSDAARFVDLPCLASAAAEQEEQGGDNDLGTNHRQGKPLRLGPLGRTARNGAHHRNRLCPTQAIQ